MSTTHLTHLLQEELDLSSRIKGLEERAARLDESFSAMNETAREISEFVKRHVNKIEIERKSWDVIDSILASDDHARDVLDHVKVFFNFLIAKMKSRGAEITDVKMLWHLHLTDGVSQIWRESLNSFGFQNSDLENIRLLLAVVYKLHTDIERKLPEKHENDKTPVKFDTEIAECIRYINSKMETLSVDVNVDGCDDDVERDANIVTNDNGEKEDRYLDSETGSFDVRVDRKLLKSVALWKVDKQMRNIVEQMISIVVYTMNVGREGKLLTIVSTDH